MNKNVLTSLIMLGLFTFSQAQESVDPAVEQQSAAEASALLEIYDVSDIVMLSSHENLVSKLSEKEAMKRNIRLAETIRTYLTPSLDEDCQEVKPLGDGTIVVMGTAEQHSWMREFLKVQRAERETFVLIDAEFFKAPFDVAKRLTSGEGPQFFNVKDRAEKKSLVAELKATEGVEFYSRRVIAYPRSDCRLSLIKKISYVSGFTVHDDVEPLKKRVVCPLIKTIDDGIELEIQVTLLPGDRFGVQLSLTDNELLRIRPISTEYGDFGMPDIRQRKADGSAILTDGSTVLISSSYNGTHTDDQDELTGKMELLTLKRFYSKNPAQEETKDDSK